MNIFVQILIGFLIGLILGFFAVISSVNSKERELKHYWENLSDALNSRYYNLKNLLNSLEIYMDGFQGKIEHLKLTLDETLEAERNIKFVPLKLGFENKINSELEDIKFKMADYPSISEDAAIQDTIKKIIESEAVVGEAIRMYNIKVVEFKTFIDIFPVSAVAWILNKNPEDYISFQVMKIEEFGDNYIDEDEI